MDYHLEKDHALGEPSGSHGSHSNHRSLTSEPSIISSTASPPNFPLPPPLARQRDEQQRHHHHHNGNIDNAVHNHHRNESHDSRAGGRGTPERPSRIKVAFSRRPSFPAVIWNDKQSISASSTSQEHSHHSSAAAAAAATAAGQTFYSEGTPPPSPTDFRSNQSSSGAPEYGAGYGFHSKPTPKLDQAYDYSYDHVAPPAPLPGAEGRRFSPKKKIFWIVLALALVLIAIAVGVGVGVSVSKSDKSSEDGTSDSSNQEPSTTTIISIEPSSTETVTVSEPASTTTDDTPAETTTSSSSTGACPSANDTVYEVPNSDKSFLRLCGIDYPGGSEAEDLATVWTRNMVDCITNCAGFPRCTACSWGAVEGDPDDNHRCYLKRDLGEPTKTRAGWDFAILQDD